MITIYDIVKFILRYRKDKVFKGLTELEILAMVKKALSARTMLVDITENMQSILGVVIATPDYDYKVLHINHILTVDPESIKRFVKQFRLRFPDWDLQAERHGNLTRYKNTNKLCERILSYGRRQ